MTTEEENDLDAKGQNFSIIKTTRNKATSFLLGPISGANHDCKANARFVSTGTSRMNIIATRDIETGEDITVPYDSGYFGENNCKCLCKTCEDELRNGWELEDQMDSARDIRVPGDYLTPGSHPGPASWTHFERCLRPTSGADGDSCLLCKRHRKLYGYRWPKTKRKGRYDNEERVYSLVL